jgi:kynurenine formamidase
VTDVPTLSELLKDCPTNWGRWGEDDEVGALNHLTAAEVLRGVAQVRSGTLFTLQRLIGDPRGDPVWPGRTPAQRTQVYDESSWERSGDGPDVPGGQHFADDRIEASLQGSTQYDALGHVWYDGKLWNGYDASTTIGGLRKASVAPIGERGVAGRGVLLDMARFRGKDNLGEGETFSHEDLEACATSQGVEIERHDILVIRTNFLKLFNEERSAFTDELCEPGLTYSRELVDWFQAKEIPNLVTDTMANEVTVDPVSGVMLPLHAALMRNMGVALTELADLEQLAAHSANDGQYSFLYTAAPLKVHRASGSPVNPIVIK